VPLEQEEMMSIKNFQAENHQPPHLLHRVVVVEGVELARWIAVHQIVEESETAIVPNERLIGIVNPVEIEGIVAIAETVVIVTLIGVIAAIEEIEGTARTEDRSETAPILLEEKTALRVNIRAPGISINEP